MEFVSTLSRWSKNLFSAFLVFFFHKKKKKKKESLKLPPGSQLISSSTRSSNQKLPILDLQSPNLSSRLPLNEPTHSPLPSPFTSS